MSISICWNSHPTRRKEVRISAFDLKCIKVFSSRHKSVKIHISLKKTHLLKIVFQPMWVLGNGGWFCKTFFDCNLYFCTINFLIYIYIFFIYINFCTTNFCTILYTNKLDCFTLINYFVHFTYGFSLYRWSIPNPNYCAMIKISEINFIWLHWKSVASFH